MDDNELAKYPGLGLRRGAWYVRKRTPVDLQHVERRRSVRYSLDTTSFREAVKRYPFKMAEIQADFERMRHELREQGKVSAALAVGKLERLSEGEIESLAAAWWARREAYRQPQVDEDDPLAVLAEEEALLARRDEGDGDPVRNLADRLLVDAGMASKPLRVGRIKTQVAYPLVDRSTIQYRYLCELITRALPLEVALARDALTVDRSAPYDPLFNPAGRKVQGQSFGGPDHRLLRDLIDGYRKEREALHGKESTDRKYGLLFRVLEEVVGATTPVAEIDRAKCVEVLTFLRKLPPNATKRFPKLSLAQAVAVAEEKGLPGLAPNTVGSYMQNLTAILNWAEQGGWGIKTNTKGLIESRRPQVKRRGFQPNELRSLFAALAQFRATKPTRFWVPALALFTGARAGEICQLRAEDVVHVEGVWCLNLTVFDREGRRIDDKRLKTGASERFVPLHPSLVATGFTDFAAGRKPQDRLFPDLTPGPKNNYSHNLSKWFGRFKKAIGFTEPSLVFHSFRHGFRDACRHADISDETGRALGGWAGIDQATNYGDRGAVRVLDRAIRRLDFGGFTLPAQ
jgi:integrase